MSAKKYTKRSFQIGSMRRATLEGICEKHGIDYDKHVPMDELRSRILSHEFRADTGDTMAHFCFSDEEWDAMPQSVQDKLRHYVSATCDDA